MSHELSTLLGLWNWFSPAWLAAAALVFLYVRFHRGIVLGARRWYFGAAVGIFLLALVSPLNQLAHGYLFSAHMAQHLMLLLAVPGLLLLSLDPARVGQALRRESLGRAASFFGSPLIGWFMGTGAMWLWHVPTFCVASQANAGIGAFQTGSLLFMGSCFWWPVFAPAQERRLPVLPSVGYLFTGCVACTLLGVYLTFSPIIVCPSFLGASDPLGLMPYLRGTWNMTPSVDQQVGGLLMWVPACLIYMSAIFGLLIRWYGGPVPTPALATAGKK